MGVSYSFLVSYLAHWKREEECSVYRTWVSLNKVFTLEQPVSIDLYGLDRKSIISTKPLTTLLPFGITRIKSTVPSLFRFRANISLDYELFASLLLGHPPQKLSTDICRNMSVVYPVTLSTPAFLAPPSSSYLYQIN